MTSIFFLAPPTKRHLTKHHQQQKVTNTKRHLTKRHLTKWHLTKRHQPKNVTGNTKNTSEHSALFKHIFFVWYINNKYTHDTTYTTSWRWCFHHEVGRPTAKISTENKYTDVTIGIFKIMKYKLGHITSSAVLWPPHLYIRGYFRIMK